MPFHLHVLSTVAIRKVPLVRERSPKFIPSTRCEVSFVPLYFFYGARAAPRLAAFHGRVIAIDLLGTGIRLYFVPDEGGRLQVLSRYEGEPDCTLAGSPLDMMRAADPEQGSAQLFAGRVRIEGDTELGHRFSEILGGLDIDWEEQLSRLVGDVAAHGIGQGIREGAEQARRSGATLEKNLSEYLTEEARLLPHPLEVEAFVDDTDRLRDDVARLEARLKLLEARGKED